MQLILNNNSLRAIIPRKITHQTWYNHTLVEFIQDITRWLFPTSSNHRRIKWLLNSSVSCLKAYSNTQLDPLAPSHMHSRLILDRQNEQGVKTQNKSLLFNIVIVSSYISLCCVIINNILFRHRAYCLPLINTMMYLANNS